MWAHRRRIQIVFQDPYSSLNPRLSAGTIVGEPLENFGIAARRATGASAWRAVRARRPAAREPCASTPTNSPAASASGSASPRRCRSIPTLIVADEPVSALDVSVQAQVLNLLIDLQEELRLAYLFISHDLAVVRHISHRIAVMYLGRIVELADKRALFAHAAASLHRGAARRPRPCPIPAAPQAQALILQGDVPSPMRPPSGCHFHTRCPYAMPECKVTDPPLLEVAPGHHVACLRRPVGGGMAPLTRSI